MAESTGIAEKDILETLVRMDMIKTNDQSDNELFIQRPNAEERRKVFEPALKKYRDMRRTGRTIKEEKLISSWLPPRLRK